MVNSVSAPYSYLSSALGIGQTPGTKTAPAPTTNNNASPNIPSAGPSLVGGNLGAFGPEILSLLQGPDSNGSFNPISNLLNGPTTNNALTGLLSDLYTSSVSAALTQAENNAKALAGNNGTSTSQQLTGANLINSLLKVSA